MNTLLVVFFLSFTLYSVLNKLSFLIMYLLIIAIYYYLTQRLFFKTPYNSIRNKTTIGTWSAQTDPMSYVKIKLDITRMEKFIEKECSQSGEKITLTMFVIKLMSIALKKYPEINGYINFGKFNLKDSVDIACLVKVDEGQDLVNGTIRSVEKMNLKDISEHLKGLVEKIRERKLTIHNKKMNIVNLIPTFILGPLIQVLSYFSSIGVSIPLFGMTPFEFGSCVITSIGSIGIEDAYPPIPPATFAPILVSICKKKNSFRYNKDYIVEKCSSISLNITFDIRFISPECGKNFYGEIRKLGENPEYFESEMNKYLKDKSLEYKKSD